jgi:NAD(P)-dependent dehydrogenase (short-subunit alcohol dehydrogenase family)
MAIDLTGRVAIVTGAGGGLGREHALLLARRGARVAVNDLGASVDGRGSSSAAAQSVADEIIAAGGEAIANGASVTDYAQVEGMVADVVARWGKVDIMVANAGILRDKSFAKMSLEDFRTVVDVHLMGSVHCVKAVWDGMRLRNYGRIVLTTSSSGLWGNFGQSNYGAAKMALVGLMQTLSLEGASANIKVNCLAPTAGTRMLEGVAPDEVIKAFNPGVVSPAVLTLVGEDAPSRTILCAGAGSFEQANITLTRGIHVGDAADAAEQIVARWNEVADRSNETAPASGAAQGAIELANAGAQARWGNV